MTTSSKEIYQKLINAISNEKASPEILEYEEQAINTLINQIQLIEGKINLTHDILDDFASEQHQLEKNRLQYVINTYLRIRIKKIEDNCVSLVKMFPLESGKMKKLLSIGEIKYLDRYFDNQQSYLGGAVFGKLNLQINDSAHTFNLVELPPNDEHLYNTTYVFVRALKTVDVIVEGGDYGGDNIRLEENSIHFLPYSSVRHHIISRSGSVLLL